MAKSISKEKVFRSFMFFIIVTFIVLPFISMLKSESDSELSIVRLLLPYGCIAMGALLNAIFDFYTTISTKLAQSGKPTYRLLEMTLKSLSSYEVNTTGKPYDYDRYTHLKLSIDQPENYVQFIRRVNIKGNSYYSIRIVYEGTTLVEESIELYQVLNLEKSIPGLTAKVIHQLREIQKDIDVHMKEKRQSEERDSKKIEKLKTEFSEKLTESR